MAASGGRPCAGVPDGRLLRHQKQILWRPLALLDPCSNQSEHY